MNKKTLRIAGWALGLSMAVAGIGTAVAASAKNPLETKAEGSWVATDISELTSEDVFAIVGKSGNNYYALSNNDGTSSAPAAVKITISAGTITSDVEDSVKWNISGNASGYTFYPNGSTETWLYCTNSNNGVRVGTNSNKAFTLDASGYLKNNVTSRYVGVYNGQDWRCYTTNGGNIADQTFSFYKLEGATVETYDITFNANGGTGEMAALPDQSGTYNLPACGFTAPSGKAFAGWKADNKGELLPVGHPYTLESDVVFYAQWANAYNVTYSAGEHGSGSFVASNQAQGTYTLLEFEDLDGVSASSGYRFVNYTVNDVDKNPGDTITLSANTSVTVNFEKIPLNTTYNFVKSWGWGTSYGSHTVNGKTEAGGKYAATINFERANIQSSGVGNDRPFCAVNNTDENLNIVFTLTEEGYKIKGVTISFVQRGSQTPTFKLYKGGSIGDTPLDTAAIGTKSTLSAANVNDTQFCISLTGTSSSNIGAALTSIAIELEELADFGTLDHIAVSSLPNVVYHVGETYSASGLVVTAYDGANEATANFKDVTASISALIENGYTFEESDVPGIVNEIEYTEGNEKKTTSFNVDVYALAEYELVTSAPNDWSGNYLIVDTTDTSDLVAMNGGLLNPDVEAGYKGVEEKTAGVIEAGQELEWTVAAVDGGYSIQGKSGKYIGSLTSNSNGMLVSNNAIANTLSIVGNNAYITGTNGYTLTHNTAGNRFRYYSGSNSVKLYKLKVSDNADAFATTFMSAFSCDAGGTNKPSFAIKEGETRWTWALLAAEYDTLTNSEKEQFRTGVASEAGTNIQQALARYDYIVGKYLKGGLDNTFTDFMSRNPSPIAGAYNVSIETRNYDNGSLLAISGAAAAFATLGGVFLISRRRREE